MQNIRYNLNKNKNGSHSIFLIFSHKKQRFKVSIKQKIDYKNWNYKKQLPKRSHYVYMELVEILDKYKKITEKHLLQLESKENNLSNDQIKNELSYLLFGNTEPKEIFTFYDYFADFIERKLADNKRNTLSTRRYVTLYRMLERYDEGLEFNKFDLEWYEDWIDWLEDQNYSRNYINSLSKGLKAFLSYCFDHGFTTNVKWKSKRFNYSGKPADNIYLTTLELQKLFEYDYSKCKSDIQRTVDIFLIGAFTGLRYTDMNNLIIKKDVITDQNVEMIKIKTSKTGETVAIPLHPIVKHIIDNRIIRKHANKTMNEYIKIAAELAGINDFVFIEQIKGGKTTIRKYYKWEKVTTHTARRSFATNAFKAGIPAISIMKITGHRSEKQFLEYIKISAEENAILLSKHDFFKTKLKLV